MDLDLRSDGEFVRLGGPLSAEDRRWLLAWPQRDILAPRVGEDPGEPEGSLPLLTAR